jgi:pyruvate/2-oxoglutarate dehydrogenase complex dihydrolipoamide acyltransferase (E2) component
MTGQRLEVMADTPIRVPRLSVAAAEATLTEFLVEEAGTVVEGDPLFVIETEKVETEIVAAATGMVRWSGTIGTVYPIGSEIGMILATED